MKTNGKTNKKNLPIIPLNTHTQDEHETNIIIYLHSYYIASVPPFMHSLILISINDTYI